MAETEGERRRGDKSGVLRPTAFRHCDDGFFLERRPGYRNWDSVTVAIAQRDPKRIFQDDKALSKYQCGQNKLCHFQSELLRFVSFEGGASIATTKGRVAASLLGNTAATYQVVTEADWHA